MKKKSSLGKIIISFLILGFVFATIINLFDTTLTKKDTQEVSQINDIYHKFEKL